MQYTVEQIVRGKFLMKFNNSNNSFKPIWVNETVSTFKEVMDKIFKRPEKIKTIKITIEYVEPAKD